MQNVVELTEKEPKMWIVIGIVLVVLAISTVKDIFSIIFSKAGFICIVICVLMYIFYVKPALQAARQTPAGIEYQSRRILKYG